MVVNLPLALAKVPFNVDLRVIKKEFYLRKMICIGIFEDSLERVASVYQRLWNFLLVKDVALLCVI